MKFYNVKEIRHHINYWQDQLKQAQAVCDHKNATKKHHSNTGNYDPSLDSYWVVYDCPDCEKHWTEDLF